MLLILPFKSRSASCALYTYVCHVHNIGYGDSVHIQLLYACTPMFGLGQGTCSHLPDFKGIVNLKAWYSGKNLGLFI